MIAIKRPNPTEDVMSAAHHCLAAENFFARAKEIYEETVNSPRKPDRFHRRLVNGLERSYQTYMEWARFHLQMAEAITHSTNLVLAYSVLHPLWTRGFSARTWPTRLFAGRRSSAGSHVTAGNDGCRSQTKTTPSTESPVQRRSS